MIRPDPPTPNHLTQTLLNDASVDSDIETALDQLEGKQNTAACPANAASQSDQSTCEPGQADASAAPPSPAGLPYGTVQRWSVLLETVPPVHRIKLLRELPEAVARGEIQAVSLNTELTHEYQNKDGQPETHTVPDEAIWYTAEIQKWMVHHVKEHVYELLAEQGRLRVDFDQLASGELDFKRLVKMRQGKDASVTKPATKPTGGGAGKSGSKITPAASTKNKSAPKRDHQKAEAPAS
ncbi:hypothetical protein E7T06_10070 [Deinococcus sp. Arct2-2]|uniref:hypothetical protein n=1 Tax=Deinococcus sp. Arct2-2 TaxID=2568653 RepID=UPI0010A4B9CF|nr:hypothetical protein [Deinococcus sp. Arct2-2]THF69840.1 hypothetical protein E7T06_10070 [Deinococcus sp. Arct2-2]